jgi:uncharacterized membrane protein YidH (DUF202 family)
MTVPENSPYYRFRNDELLLRDLLAVERTVQANERTFLGFLRTALAFTVAGLSLVKFFDNRVVEAIGYVLCISALPMLWVGLVRYRLRRAALKPMLKRVE